MTRKERKTFKKTKGASLKKRRREARKEKKLAWEVAKVLSKYQEFPTEYQNKKFYCSICKMEYCLGFTETDIFCSDCHYRLGCFKETFKAKNCNYCERRTP
jgi:hypothetical protein